MLRGMGDTSFWPGDSRASSRRRKRIVRSVLLIAFLALIGALLDPQLIAPFGPLASRAERVSTTFTRCGQGTSFACVVDGDTLRLGDRRVRLIGIDTPELTAARCPGEAALAERAADRLLALVNAGPFDIVAHRFWNKDGHGRDLRLLKRGHVSIGQTLVGEGLARRYYGSKTRWC